MENGHHGDGAAAKTMAAANKRSWRLLLGAMVVGLALGCVLGACGVLGGGTSQGDDGNEDDAASDATTEAQESTDVEENDDADETEPVSATLPEGAVANIAELIVSAPVNCSFDEIIPLPVAPTCHELSVPEDWNSPDPDDQVILQVAVFDGDGASDDPIIYLDGGPGGHTLEALSFSFPDLIEPQLNGRDFIVFDQRGVGESQPSLHCPELTALYYEDLAGVTAKKDLPAATFDAQTDCVTRLETAGSNLEAYNSVASANDMEAIRLALGYDQFNAIGISYGTRLGQTYMRMYPGSVRSIVLDSVLPTGANLWTDFNTGAERAFEQLFAGCAASAGCSSTYPNFEDDFFALLDELDANPVPLDLNNLTTGQTIPSVLDGDDVMGLVFQALYSQSLFSFVPAMTAAATDDHYSNLQLLGSIAATNLNYISTGMQLSVECNEEIPFESAAARAATVSADPRYQRIDRALAGSPNIFEACERWPSGAAPAVESETVTSDVPTLLLAGQYDPITPPAGMDTIAGGLSASFQFTFPHEGHGITPSECGAKVVAAFIDDPTTEPDSSCISDSPAPPWTR